MRRGRGKLLAGAAGLLAVVVLSLTGCGIYSASSGRVSGEIRRVAVPYLENFSAEPDIEVELTEGLITAIQEDNTLKVVSEDNADSILSGKVVRYQLVNAFQVQIAVELTFTVVKTGKHIFENKRFIGTGNYQLDDPAGRDISSARQDAAGEIVRDVLAQVVESW